MKEKEKEREGEKGSGTERKIKYARGLGREDGNNRKIIGAYYKSDSHLQHLLSQEE